MFYLILLAFVALFIVIYQQIRRDTKSNQHLFATKSDYASEWGQKVSTARLNAKLYETSNRKERYDLLYYYTYKLLRKQEVESLPDVLKVFYMIDILEAQVNNGGMHQLFANSSGKYIAEIIDSLTKIGANHTRDIVERTVQIFRKAIGRDIGLDELYDNIDSITITDDVYEQLTVLDKDFYSYTDDLYGLTLDYVDANKESLWRQLD